jgi:hypothetical protein
MKSIAVMIRENAQHEEGTNILLGSTTVKNLVSRTEPVAEDLTRYSRFYDFIAVFGGYFIITFIVIGLFGNVLSIVIFIRRRKRDNASAVYLGCLAVSDLGNLTCGYGFWHEQSLYYISHRQINLPFTPTDLGCKISTYVWFNCQFMSAWIIIAFSVERMIAVLFPLKAASIATPKRRKCILFCIFVISLTTWIDMAYVNRIVGQMPPGKPYRSLCHFDPTEAPEWFLIVACVQVFALIQVGPSVIISVLNTVIVIGMRSRDLTLDSGAKDQTRSKKEMRCLMNLLTVSTTYVVLMCPFVATWAYYFYESFTGFQGRSLAFVDFLTELAYFTTSITMVNYGVNFIIYTISLQFYREELKKLFCFGKRKA